MTATGNNLPGMRRPPDAHADKTTAERTRCQPDESLPRPALFLQPVHRLPCCGDRRFPAGGSRSAPAVLPCVPRGAAVAGKTVGQMRGRWAKARQRLQRAVAQAAAQVVALSLFAVVPHVAAVAPAIAAPRNTDVRLAWLKLSGAAEPDNPLQAWAQEVRLRTSVRVAAEPLALRPEDSQLFHYPLLYWGGDRAPARLSDVAVARLRSWLQAGGTLLIDNTGRTEASAAFDSAIRRELARILPQPLERVPGSHVLFRAFYRLERAVGRRADSGELEGIALGGHYAVLYSRNDLAGALQRAGAGGYALSVVPGGEDQRERAIRLLVNVVLYALCLDYKDDHTHVMHLLQTRRGRGAMPAKP